MKSYSFVLALLIFGMGSLGEASDRCLNSGKTAAQAALKMINFAAGHPPTIQFDEHDIKGTAIAQVKGLEDEVHTFIGLRVDPTSKNLYAFGAMIGCLDSLGKPTYMGMGAGPLVRDLTKEIGPYAGERSDWGDVGNQLVREFNLPFPVLAHDLYGISVFYGTDAAGAFGYSRVFDSENHLKIYFHSFVYDRDSREIKGYLTTSYQVR